MKIALVGQPNSGKSTLFNVIAGFKANTSNLPGTTVTFTESRVNIGGRIADVVDLPGTYSLSTGDLAELETLKYLIENDIDVVINVIDASLLSRSLELTLELLDLGLPTVVALNMMDEAERKGIEIDVDKLSEMLGVPVVPVIAVHGKGIKKLFEAVFETARKNTVPRVIRYPAPVEEKIREMEDSISEELARKLKVTRRFLAVKLLEGDEFFLKKVKEEFPDIENFARTSLKELEEKRGIPADQVLHSERHNLAMCIFEKTARIKRKKGPTVEEKIDRVVMHHFWGYPIMALVLLLFFYLIFSIGGPLEEFFLGPLDALRDRLSSSMGSGLLLNLIDGFLQGIEGGLAVVLPYFVPLVFLMSFLEDLGYLPRIAFLLDTFMHKIGLHGKSVIPFIVGYGCNVPSITATRILESPRDRILTALLIPFIPCSAKTTVILALVAFYLGPLWALGLYVTNIFVVAILGRVISGFFPTPSPGLILEIPSYKLPSMKVTFLKTWLHLKTFINFAWPILIVGSIIMGFLQFLKVDLLINAFFAPLTRGILNLPGEVATTLIFGILRKELSLIMLFQALGTSHVSDILTTKQILTFTVFVIYYIPCLSTLAMLWREFGKKIALLSALLNTGVATLLAFLVRIL